MNIQKLLNQIYVVPKVLVVLIGVKLALQRVLAKAVSRTSVGSLMRQKMIAYVKVVSMIME
jgi:hypothetical protein